jgi:type I restriction enzyme S subunit
MNVNWNVKKLAELVKIKPSKSEVRGKMPESSLVSFLPMEDLHVFDRKISPVKERMLKDVIDGYTYFKDGDVLVAKITPCFENGKMGIATGLKNGVGFGSSEYIVLRCLGEITPEYLYYFFCMSSFRNEGRQIMTGAVGHKRVPLDFVENYDVPYPTSLSEQDRIVSLLDTAFDAVNEAKTLTMKKLVSLDELKESILSAAFSGELPKSQD